MREIRKKDGSLLTEKEIQEIRNEVIQNCNPLEKRMKFSKLEGMFIYIMSGFVEISKAEIKDNKIFFELKCGNYIFEENAIYPLSDFLDEKESILSTKFMTFLEWQVLKNIDKIAKKDNLI